MKYESINLPGLRLEYGKTTLAELLRAGYSVREGEWAWHDESQTVMSSFYRRETYMGELCFYDVATEPRHLDDLHPLPIGLVLPDEVDCGGDEDISVPQVKNTPKPPRSPKPSEKGASGPHAPLKVNPRVAAFFKRIGVPLTKGNVYVMGGMYLFLWLILAFDLVMAVVSGPGVVGGNIPPVFFYIVTGFPFAFFAVCMLFFGLNSLFTRWHRTLPPALYFVLCLGLGLLWSFVCAWTTMLLRTHAWLWIIPIVCQLTISCWAVWRIIEYQMLERKPNARFWWISIPVMITGLAPVVIDRYVHPFSLREVLDSLSISGSVTGFFLIDLYFAVAVYSLMIFLMLLSMVLGPRKRP